MTALVSVGALAVVAILLLFWRDTCRRGYTIEAAIGVESARLIAALERQTLELTALRETAQATLAHATDHDQHVLTRETQKLARITELLETRGVGREMLRERLAQRVAHGRRI